MICSIESYPVEGRKIVTITTFDGSKSISFYSDLWTGEHKGIDLTKHKPDFTSTFSFDTKLSDAFNFLLGE
jgi:hypothetical protein